MTNLTIEENPVPEAAKINPRPLPRFPLGRWAATICAFYGTSHDDLLSPSRKAVLVKPRQLFMFLARQDGWSSSQIARYLCRDHTTILYGEGATAAELETNPDLALDVEKIKSAIDPMREEEDASRKEGLTGV